MELITNISIQYITNQLVNLLHEEISYISFTVPILKITMLSLIFYMKNVHKKIRQKLKSMKGFLSF